MQEKTKGSVNALQEKKMRLENKLKLLRALPSVEITDEERENAIRAVCSMNIDKPDDPEQEL